MGWKVHENGYLDNFETSFLCHHNFYPEGKQGGVEIIHHDERLATNGFVRLFIKENEDAGFPQLKERRVNIKEKLVEADVSFKKINFTYTVKLKAEKKGIRLSLVLPLSFSEIGCKEARFEISLYSIALWNKRFIMDNYSGIFPREVLQEVKMKPYPDILPLATGKRLVISPDEPVLNLKIYSLLENISLHDERWNYDGEWFSLRTVLPLDIKEEIPVLFFVPSKIFGWKKKTVISVSSAGFHPDQVKRAIIELDRRTKIMPLVILERLTEKGYKKVLYLKAKRWGVWLRYLYALFDFSKIKEEGVYRIHCNNSDSGPFLIRKDIFNMLWQPTLAEFFPVQMCHMEVWKHTRLWHAACHLDDAMQVESPFDYIDGYHQAEESDSPFKPYEHVPFLDVGGWHDAGDTDLAAGSQIKTTYILGLCREEFGVDFDQTTIVKQKRLVLMREPDGIPDIVQQIEHGIECVLGGYRACGHSFCGIIESIPKRYYQRGEVSAMTDNRIYDPSLKEDEIRGNRSGLKDDRFVFTNRDSGLEFAAIGTLALASRVLKGWNDPLSSECIETAKNAWNEEIKKEPVRRKTTYVPHDINETRVKAAVELFITTDDISYLHSLSLWKEEIIQSAENTAWILSRVWDDIPDKNFKSLLFNKVVDLSKKWKESFNSNPFGISFRSQIWGIAWNLQELAVKIYFLSKRWSELFDNLFIFNTIAWVTGCHPANNVSFVSGVGTKSLTEAFGINRSDWSYIAGGNASGVALIQPDFPELKINNPWLWQQSEYVMSGAATWIFSSLAAEKILK